MVSVPRHPIHRFTRVFSYNLPLWDGSGFGSSLSGVATDAEIKFALYGAQISLGGTPLYNASLPNRTEFTNLFNEYKIEEVEMTLFFSNNNSSLNSPQISLPILNVAFDPNDINATSLSDIQQFENLITFQMGNGADRTRTFKFKPKPQILNYNGATSGYSTMKDGWINSTYYDVPHYGVKIVYDPTTSPASSTNIGSIAMYFKAKLAFRNVD